MEAPPSEAEFPMYLYIHNEAGLHSGKTTIPDGLALTQIFAQQVIPAMKAGLEVIVTDALDFCIFHAQDGQVIFPEAWQCVPGPHV